MNPKFKLTAKDIKIKQENSLELFYSGIKAKATKETMERMLRYFLVDVCTDLLQGDFGQRAQQFVEIAGEDQTKATNIIIAYVKKLRERTALDKSDSYYMNPSYLPNKIKPIKKLLTMNDVGLAWKRIYTFYPEKDNTHQGRGYARTEIRKLLEYSANIDTDFIILASSSGGLRLGAWNDLRWKDVFPIYDVDGKYRIDLKDGEQGKVVCAALIVYKNTKEQYTALISLEKDCHLGHDALTFTQTQVIRQYDTKGFIADKRLTCENGMAQAFHFTLSRTGKRCSIQNMSNFR
mgnify:CR=1 FL=1